MPAVLPPIPWPRYPGLQNSLALPPHDRGPGSHPGDVHPHGAVTGKGLADLIRERFGVRITFYAMAGLFIGNLGNIMSEFAGVAASMELFGVTKYLSLPWRRCSPGGWCCAGPTRWWSEFSWPPASSISVTSFPAIWLTRTGGRSPGKLIIPSFSFDSTYVVIVVGLIGTTIAPGCSSTSNRPR